MTLESALAVTYSYVLHEVITTALPPRHQHSQMSTCRAPLFRHLTMFYQTWLLIMPLASVDNIHEALAVEASLEKVHLTEPEFRACHSKPC